VGNIVALLGTGFLVGFLTQLKAMCAAKRIIATILYVVSLIGTLLAVFLIPNAGAKFFVAILCILIQFCCLVWCVTATRRRRRRRRRRVVGGAAGERAARTAAALTAAALTHPRLLPPSLSRDAQVHGQLHPVCAAVPEGHVRAVRGRRDVRRVARATAPAAGGGAAARSVQRAATIARSVLL
jgi:cytochrome bd-type quinol oxidase subunit 2